MENSISITLCSMRPLNTELDMRCCQERCFCTFTLPFNSGNLKSESLVQSKTLRETTCKTAGIQVAVWAILALMGITGCPVSTELRVKKKKPAG